MSMNRVDARLALTEERKNSLAFKASEMMAAELDDGFQAALLNMLEAYKAHVVKKWKEDNPKTGSLEMFTEMSDGSLLIIEVTKGGELRILAGEYVPGPDYQEH